MKRYYDKDICLHAQDLLKKHGCEIVLNDKVTDIVQVTENE